MLLKPIYVQWPVLKEFVDSRKVSIQYVEDQENYYLRALDGLFSLACDLTKSIHQTDVLEFEQNYKALSNRPPRSVVVPTSEFNDKTLKLASLQIDTDGSGRGEASMRVPGAFNGTDGRRDPPCNGRYIEYGIGWFKNPIHGDKCLGIYVEDRDRILAQVMGGLSDEQMRDPSMGSLPSYPIIGSYTDDEMPSLNQGWYLNASYETKIDAASGPGFVPSGMYIVVKVQKSPDAPKDAQGQFVPDTFYSNFKWSAHNDLN
jgi:hypothetical protein